MRVSSKTKIKERKQRLQPSSLVANGGTSELPLKNLA